VTLLSRLAPPLLLGALLLGTLTPAARAQSPDFRSRIDEQTAAVVMPVLEEAARDSLPLHALESKVLEGITKRVPPERIGPVVAQMASEFRSVRAELRTRLPGVPFTDDEIVASARAVRENVPVERVAELWSARQGREPMAVSVTVLGELVRRGVPAAEAAQAMGHVVRAGVPVEVAAQIPGRVDGALGAAGNPGAALNEALRVLEIPAPRGRGPGGRGPPGGGRRPGG
jgi:hypothetical protein